jgi:NADH-quinone oxidoreductase subunit G
MDIKVAVVSGLAEAGRLLADVKAGKATYDLVEVMACPGGCIGGAGQPVCHSGAARAARAKGIVAADRAEILRNPAENDQVRTLYREHLGDPGSHTAHDWLHTGYQPRKRLGDMDLLLTTGDASTAKLLVMACLGTSCHLHKSQNLVNGLIETVQAKGLGDRVDVRATFCLERCGEGPNVKVGDQIVTQATVEKVMTIIQAELAKPCSHHGA